MRRVHCASRSRRWVPGHRSSRGEVYLSTKPRRCHSADTNLLRLSAAWGEKHALVTRSGEMEKCVEETSERLQEKPCFVFGEGLQTNLANVLFSR